MATPKVTRTLYDNNLDRSVPQGPTNRRVVILGTATDGPMYEPLQVKSPAEAEELFGAFGEGTLVRGLKECIDAQAGSSATPDTWGMRIGGVNATRAITELQDVGGNKVAEIEAINEGSVYNDVTIEKKQDANGVGWIYVYNPKTELSSKFSVDLTIDELAAAINVDPNTKDIIFAVSATADNEALLEFSAAAGTYSNNQLSVNMEEEATDSLWPVAQINSVYTVSASAEYEFTGSASFSIPSGSVADETAADDLLNSNGQAFEPITAGANLLTADANKVYYKGTEIVSGVLANGSGEATVAISFDADILGDAAIDMTNAVVTVTDEADANTTETFSDETLTVSAVNACSWDLSSVAFADKTVTVSVAFDTSENKKTVVKADNPAGEFQYKIASAAGKSLRFGAVPSYTMVLRYAQKKYYEESAYEESSNSIVIDAPDLSDTNVVLGFSYLYLAADPSWASTYSLAGGQDGTVMTNDELKSDLDEAYEHFIYDFFDVMCVTDLTADAVLADGNAAGYAPQMSAFFRKV